ncbi:MAG TPA: response regulator [Deinococcales bacterium]|nr:response regulator [Deinococcales bacterium]
MLVVEDRETDAYIINKAIQKLGHDVEVSVAGSVAAAQAFLLAAARGERRHPTVVMLDLQLPDGPGLTLIEWARAQPALAFTRFVVVSNYLDNAITRLAYAAGANSVVPKHNIMDDLNAVRSVADYWLSVNRPLLAR